MASETLENLKLLKENLKYSDCSGRLYWSIDRKYRMSSAGEEAGSTCLDGYRRIKIDKKEFKAHRVCWALYYGEWPTKYLDHIDGNRSNNIISNLREVDSRGNNSNRVSHRSGKILGAQRKLRKGKLLWESYIYINRKNVYLGIFKTPEEAGKAYLDKLAQLQKP